jgi:hypothetical protein
LNWYKLSQIWNVKDDSFMGLVFNMYKLEYQRHLIRQKKGFSKRKDNILNNINNQLNYIVQKLKVDLKNILIYWLDLHSDNPDIWAKSRVKEIDEEETGISPLESFRQQYVDYNYPMHQYGRGTDLNTVWNKILPIMQRNMNQFPVFSSICENIENNLQHDEQIELESEGIDNFNNNNGTNFTTERQCLQYIKDRTERSASEFIDLENLSSYDQEDLRKELFKFFIYPAWSKRWENDGILVRVMKNNKDTLKLLNESKDLNSSIIAVNMALNSIHSRGDILSDYGSKTVNTYNENYNDPNEFLSDLSNGKFTKQWKNEVNSLKLS